MLRYLELDEFLRDTQSMSINLIHRSPYGYENTLDIEKMCEGLGLVYVAQIDNKVKINIGICEHCGSLLKYVFDFETNTVSDYVYSSDKELTDLECYHVLNKEFVLKVPSGRLVCQSEIPYYDYVDSDITLSSVKGIMDTIELNIVNNVCFVYTGNSSPSLYLDNTDLVLVNSNDYGVRVAETITDLWWVTLVDVDILKEYCIEKGSEFREECLNICEVPKGNYLCKYEFKEDYEESVILRITKI